MRYIVIIPAYNEAQYIEHTLRSITEQSLLPSLVVVVDDNSSDTTSALVEQFCKDHTWIKLVHKDSKQIHLPGSKVIQAFNFGLNTISIDTEYDFIVKLDADLILPFNYFKTIASEFTENPLLGMAGGVALIERHNQWVVENLTDKDHIRGAFKAYTKKCFTQIGGLQPAMGWDTVDELLCRYYNWEILVRQDLQIKHLKPTGAQYDKTARYKQGEAFYCLHYGFLLTLIASTKLALKKKKPLLLIDYLQGFYKAKKEKKVYLVNNEQGKFIRKFRWQKIKSKLL